MPQLTTRELKLLQYLLATAETMLSDALLDTCADLDYRLCLVELGIN